MKKQIESSLHNAVSQLPHPSAEKIWSETAQKMNEHDYITRQSGASSAAGRRRSGSLARRLNTGLAALLLFVAVGLWSGQNLLVDTLVDIDVNPSFEITANKKERVLKVVALNADAEQVLAGRDFSGWDIEATVETLALSMADNNYFDGGAQAALLSVANKDEARRLDIEQRLANILLAVINMQGGGTVVMQELSGSVRSAAGSDYSAGKARVIEQLLAADATLSLEQLLSMSMAQLLALAERNGQTFSYIGLPLSYIGLPLEAYDDWDDDDDDGIDDDDLDDDELDDLWESVWGDDWDDIDDGGWHNDDDDDDNGYDDDGYGDDDNDDDNGYADNGNNNSNDDGGDDGYDDNGNNDDDNGYDDNSDDDNNGYDDNGNNDGDDDNDDDGDDDDD